MFRLTDPLITPVMPGLVSWVRVISVLLLVSWSETVEADYNFSQMCSRSCAFVTASSIVKPVHAVMLSIHRFSCLLLLRTSSIEPSRTLSTSRWFGIRQTCPNSTNFLRRVVSTKSLHWLKVNERIEYKILSLTYKLLNTTQPSYLYAVSYTHLTLPTNREV